jgi:hypothetical protein
MLADQPPYREPGYSTLSVDSLQTVFRASDSCTFFL